MSVSLTWKASLLQLNNQDSIYTANDAIGFGVREANGDSAGAGQAKYPNILSPSSGTIWVRGRATAPPQQFSEFFTRPEQPSCVDDEGCAEQHFCARECWQGPCAADRNVCQPCEECNDDADALDGDCGDCGTECAQVPINACTASSIYSEQYHCENVFDGATSDLGSGADEMTAWATQGEGVGSWIELSFASPQNINAMKYANRDAFAASGQEANKQVRLDFSDGSSATVDLLPVENENFDHYYSFPSVVTSSVRITVLTVYGTVNNGAEEIAFFGCDNVDAYEAVEVWSVGGCANWNSVSTENDVVILEDKEYSLESCAEACMVLDWCTHIFMGIAGNTRCIPIGDGCTQDSNDQWSYYRVARMNTGTTGEGGRVQLELTAAAWTAHVCQEEQRLAEWMPACQEGTVESGTVVWGEETSVAQGAWIESQQTFQRPTSVTAEIKSGANPECITMSLFAPDHGKNSPYSLETGGWSNKVRIFPGDYRQEVGPNDHWHSVRIEATADGEVRYSLDDVVVYTVTDTSLQSGTVQFIAGCVPMVVRNVVVVTSADHVGYTAAPHCSDGFAPILQADECARAAEELG